MSYDAVSINLAYMSRRVVQTLRTFPFLFSKFHYPYGVGQHPQII
jgi:hypothetical protein